MPNPDKTSYYYYSSDDIIVTFGVHELTTHQNNESEGMFTYPPYGQKT